MSGSCLNAEDDLGRIRILMGTGYYRRFFPILTNPFTFADLDPDLQARLNLHAFLAKHRSAFRPGSSNRKKCSRCQKVLHRSKFSKDSCRPDGLFHACKVCIRDYRRLLRESGQKQCSRCRRIFSRDAEHFHRNSAHTDGLGNICKICKRAYQYGTA